MMRTKRNREGRPNIALAVPAVCPACDFAALECAAVTERKGRGDSARWSWIGVGEPAHAKNWSQFIRR